MDTSLEFARELIIEHLVKESVAATRGNEWDAYWIDAEQHEFAPELDPVEIVAEAKKRARALAANV